MGNQQYRSQIILMADIFIFVLANLFLCIFSEEFANSRFLQLLSILPNILLLLACILIFQILFHTYESLWRYAESREYLLLFAAITSGSLSYLLLSGLMPTRLPFVYLVAVSSLSLVGMLLMRFLYRLYRSKILQKQTQKQTPIAIIGAGAAGILLLTELQTNAQSHCRTVCFFDDSQEKIGKQIRGVPVLGSIDKIPEHLQNTPIQKIVVAIPSLNNRRRHEILNICAKIKGVRILIIPNALTLMSNSQSLSSQLQEIHIEDLLGREPINLNTEAISKFLSGKTVLVTGGGGSIGSELCRQIAKQHPKHLIIVDIYENNAYDIQQELLRNYRDMLNLTVEIASVRDKRRINQLFAQYRPQIVFHAAAHKHVPLMETSPQEAIRNNVLGTLNVVLAADQYGVSKFVQISTDKAVNPTNVMGATKRLCEMILQSMKGNSKTDFVAVRFGNVLGSNGSVVPLFKKQIAEGGPITLTDKRIIRYFMTITEATQLVLQAGAIAKKSEVFVLDMGSPVKILDLAENIIRLSGYEPYTEIPILETGLRPGEKLYEELLIFGKNIEKTDYQKIFIEHQPALSPQDMKIKLDILLNALETENITEIRKALHLTVPSFREPNEINLIQGNEIILPNHENTSTCASASITA